MLVVGKDRDVGRALRAWSIRMSRQVEFKLFMARYLAKAVRAVATHGLQGVVRAWSIRMSRQVEFKLFTARHFDELLQVVPISRLIGPNGIDADKKNTACFQAVLVGSMA